MKFPIQMFGTIQTEHGTANLIFSHDEDRPDEAMLQWHGNGVEPGGVQVTIREIAKNRFEFAPQVFYRCDDRGGLHAPPHLENGAELFKARADVKLSRGILKGAWSGLEGRGGDLTLETPPKNVRIDAEVLASWKDFKDWASQQQQDRTFIDFRGHGSSKFPLKTTLHRAGRGRMERFCYETMPAFRDLAESIVQSRFREGDNEDFSVLLGLAQHHGLPTPLLDWTASPYIAAFFAFSDAFENIENRKGHTHVRIFALSEAMRKTAPRVVSLTSVSPHISYLLIPSRKNPRLLAQQGRFLVTNIDDVEGMICGIERSNSGTKLLKAVDIPIVDAVEALEDLAFMGLSAATMFPGLDGACKMMKYAMAFRRQPVALSPLAEAPGIDVSSENQREGRSL